MENQSITNQILNKLAENLVKSIKEDEKIISDNSKLLKSFQLKSDIMEGIFEDNKSQVINFDSLRTLQNLAENNGKIVKLQGMVQDLSESEQIIQKFSINKKKIGQNTENMKDNISLNILSNSFSMKQDQEQILDDIQSLHLVQIPKIYAQKEGNQQEKQQQGQKIYYKDVEVDSQEDLQNLYSKLKQDSIYNFDGSQGVNQFPCILNFLNLTQKKFNLKLHSLVEVYGVLNFEIQEQDQQQYDDEEQQDLDQFDMGYHGYYPYSLVPRIDVVHYKNIDSPNLAQLENLKQNDGENIENYLRESYEVLMELLNEICLGDKVVAQYILLNLLSSTIFEQDGINYGKQILNVYRIPSKDFVYKLDDKIKLRFSQVVDILVQQIMPFVKTLPLSLEFLNSNNFSPNKNMDNEQFQHGLLQFPKELQNFLLMDETYLENGQLQDKGVKNIQILNELLNNSQLHIVTEYFKTQIPIDACGLVLSEGKTFVYHDLKVNFKEKNDKGEIDLSPKLKSILLQQDKDLVNRLRLYILHSRLNVKMVELDDIAKENISKQYLGKREEQREIFNQLDKELQINPETLQRWIQFTKIISSSQNFQYGTDKSVKIQQSHFDQVKEIEQERLNRYMQIQESQKEKQQQKEQQQQK